ncbi:MAG: NAD-dependent protein deacylase Sir2 [Phycisphaerae bacterium]|nr:NAD-dependent protein deacylase Sir2 [Phycisphaerae bacterium]
MTGAGVSAESGLSTFRGAGGLWEGSPVQEVAHPEGFAHDPDRVWRFYNARRLNLLKCDPNPAHHALVQLAHCCPRLSLITQNVDGLHRRAGSRNVLELHGNIWLNTCTQCTSAEHVEARWRASSDPPEESRISPRCGICGALLRPGVVWFGEHLPSEALHEAEHAVRSCDVMLVVGTSSVVYPAAALARVALGGGAFVIEINVERTPLSDAADAVLSGKAGVVLPELAKCVASGSPRRGACSVETSAFPHD